MANLVGAHSPYDGARRGVLTAVACERVGTVTTLYCLYTFFGVFTLATQVVYRLALARRCGMRVPSVEQKEFLSIGTWRGRCSAAAGGPTLTPFR